MTSVTATGSISISSCFKCEKVFMLAEGLSKSMHDFEILTMEMEFGNKSAKSQREQSQKVLSNFWELISTIQSLKTDTLAETEKDACDNQALTGIVGSVKQRQVRTQIQNLGTENEPAKPSFSARKMRRRPPPKSNPILRSTSDLNIASKRANEIKRARTLLRTIKCETREGFYNVFECLKCQLQFSALFSGLNHVQNVHLKLGAHCPTCHKKYFTKSSLDLHIPNCRKRQQLKKIKVWLKKDSTKPVQVPLHPHQQQKQGQASSTRNRNQNRNQKPSKKVQNQRGKSKKFFDPLTIKVRNPFPNFSLEKTLDVKVVIERLKMEERGDISIISHVPPNE